MLKRWNVRGFALLVTALAVGLLLPQTRADVSAAGAPPPPPTPPPPNVVTSLTTPSGSGLSENATTGDITLKLLQTCSNGQVLKWNTSGSSWGCADDANAGGTITGVTAGTGLTGGGTSGVVTVAVQVPLSLSGSDSSSIITATNSSDSGGGLRGESTVNNGVGVYAISKTVGLLANVDGTHDPNAGGADFTKTAGVNAGNNGNDGSGNGTGVYGIGRDGDGVYGQLDSSSTTRAAVHGKQSNSSGLAGYFEGNVKVAGNLTITGTCTGCTAAPSDRNLKDNVGAVDSRQTLERLLAIPVESWSYKSDDPSVRHIGPMAQDLAAAFGLGPDDKRIDLVDANGVAFAAIQGLYQVVQQKDAQIAAQEQRLTALERQNAALEARLSALEQQAGINSSPGPLGSLPAGWPLVGGFLLGGLALRRRRD